MDKGVMHIFRVRLRKVTTFIAKWTHGEAALERQGAQLETENVFER